MTTTILALDLGTTTGWALRGSDGHITSGSESFRPQRFEGGGMRFLRFKRWLTEIKQSCDGIDACTSRKCAATSRPTRPTPTAASSPRSPRGASTTRSRIRACRSARSRSTPPARATPARMSGGASVTARGHAPVDDNEADALALLHWAIEQHALEREV
jgi:hypothetical protein